jgi:hypothetical protein
MKEQQFSNNYVYGEFFLNEKVDGYRNINEIYIQKNQLHACETLFGDWNAEIMILAQDAANFDTFQKIQLISPNSNPFHHVEKVKTNQNIFELLKSLSIFNLGSYTKPNNKNCGVYYANAIWLLKESKGMSGNIINKDKIFDSSKKVFEATVNNLKNLKLVITLGEKSFQFLKHSFPNDLITTWPKVVTNNEINLLKTSQKSIYVASIYHPSIRGLIGRAKLSSPTNKTFMKGFELTKTDLHKIFNNFNSLKG